MQESVEAKIMRWIQDRAYGPEIQETDARVRQLEDDLFCEYEPTRGPHRNFRQRLADWISNRDDEAEQRLLLRLVPQLFFVGPREMEVLYRIAFHTHIARWLLDQLNVTFHDLDIEPKLQEGVRHTWFCPITDSMRINSFYHLNHLTGRDFRPDWRSLLRFGSEVKIADYMRENQISRLVLLEDFVGSGSQMLKAVEFAASLPTEFPILVVPLIVCPRGVQTGFELMTQFPNVEFSPLLLLDSSAFIMPVPQPGEPALGTDMRRLAQLMFASLPAEEQNDVYTPFGFAETGSIVVLFTNCPDNTLPLIHHRSVKWSPLFPRASRL
jgi:hypothetical protein